MPQEVEFSSAPKIYGEIPQFLITWFGVNKNPERRLPDRVILCFDLRICKLDKGIVGIAPL